MEESSLPNDSRFLRIEDDRLAQEINKLKLNIESEKEESFDKDSTFRWLSDPMKQWAAKLSLEDSDSGYYFNFDKLTIEADRKGQSLLMSEMRGHFNWVGCHLLAFLSLHKVFIERNSPVPNFVIFDQPPDENIKKVLDLFIDISKELHPNLQIIVMTHSNLDSMDKYKDFLVEPFWNANKTALVPLSWIEESL